ncbi:MAG: polyprenyl synthetase family protein [Phycisphaerales bacterium]|nr:polyprenyl synthetase family protein [Phycisphaerales bacterium]
MSAIDANAQNTQANGDVVRTLRPALDRVAHRLEEHIDTPEPAVAKFVQHVEHLRGKMLRPTLAFVSGLAVNPKLPEDDKLLDDVVTVGAVIELIHLATLVHDDVLDESDERRGKPSVHAAHGQHAAIILGDYLFARSFHLCSTLDTQATALRVGEITALVCAGEMEQMGGRDDWAMTKDDYFRIIERKTALLIGAACELGSRHGATSPNRAHEQALLRYGLLVGSAFQIQDDLLDLAGDPKALGKPAGRDIAMGKPTLPIILHLDTAACRTCARPFHALLARVAEGDEDAHDDLIDALDSTGSLAGARDEAMSRIAQAIESLGALPETPARAHLAALAEGALNRQA